MSRAPFIQLSQIGLASSVTVAQSDDPEATSGSFPANEKAILQVIDAPFDGSKPKPIAVLNSGDDIKERLSRLPKHKSGTARILDVTVHSNFVMTGLRDMKGPKTMQTARDDLIDFLHSQYTQLFEERRLYRWLSDPLLANDIGSISCQWSQQLGGDDSNLYRIVNRSSLQQHPFDYDVHPRDSYLTCAQDTEDRLIIIIVHDVLARRTFSVKKTRKWERARKAKRSQSHESSDEEICFENPRCTSSMLAEDSLTSFSDGTLDNFAKLLALDFFLAPIYLQRVDYYGALIYPKLSEEDVIKFALTKNPHLQVPLELFEPRLSSRSSEAFKEIEDAEGILRNITNLIDSIEFVVAELERSKIASSGGSDPWQYKARMQKITALCKERGDNANNALEALQRQLEYLTSRHAIREAKSIKTLTILASLYLPQSLAAAALGMQSPFKQISHTRGTSIDLEGTNLLFDFFGIFIGLGVLTVFIVWFIRAVLREIRTNGLWIFSNKFGILDYGKHWRFGGREGKLLQGLRRITIYWIIVMLCITLLTIFMVGMLENAQKAWDTARWMFAAYAIVSGLLTLSCLGLYRWLYLKKLHDWRFRWSVSSWLDIVRL